MTNVSFDLETLHTRADAKILSIAAAARVNGEIVTFYSHCNLNSQMWRFASAATLLWWQERPALWDKTREACRAAPSLPAALQELSEWCRALGEIQVWGNGADFDIAILNHAFDEADMETPWHYRAARDLRTLWSLAEQKPGYVEVERYGTHHDARDDAITQLLMIENCLRHLLD